MQNRLLKRQIELAERRFEAHEIALSYPIKAADWEVDRIILAQSLMHLIKNNKDQLSEVEIHNNYREIKRYITQN